MAGVKLNEASLEKKLYHAEPTQQGIQALTKWIMAHKDHYPKIVELWRKILKKSQPKHRLTLFYVANDVIQYARRKKVNDLYSILKTAIHEVVPMLREDSILPSVQRVLSVWLDRDIFEEEYVQGLRDSLDKQKLQAAQNAKIVERFKPSEMTDKIKEMMSREEENEKKLKMLKLVKVDVSSPEAIQQIKDRMHGTKHCNDFEDACSKLEDYVTSLGQQIQLQKDVGDRLVQSQVYYEHQYGEAKIVANAYKNFSLRVNNLRKRLAEFIKILPDPEEPEPEALSPEYDAPSPGNTPPPDLTKDHIMDEHMDVSDGEEQEPNLVFEHEKSSPIEPNLSVGDGGRSDGEESNSSFDVDALLEKDFDNSPQATPSQKSKRYSKTMEPQSPPPPPRPQHPAVASFLNTSYKTETRSSSANSSPSRNVDGGSSRSAPSALDQRLAALTAKGGETMMSLFGGLQGARDGEDDEVCSNGSQGENSMKTPKSGEKRPYESSPERNGGGDRTPTRDEEAVFERSSKSLRTSSPLPTASSEPAPALTSKPPRTPVGPHTPSGSEPQTPTTSSECGTPVRAPFFPPGAPVPPTPPPSIAILNPGVQSGTIGTPPPKKPQPPVFKSLSEETVPPLPPPPPFPTFFNMDSAANVSVSSTNPSTSVASAPPLSSTPLVQPSTHQQQPPQSPATPQLQPLISAAHLRSPATPHSAPPPIPTAPLLAAAAAAGLTLTHPPPPIPIAPVGLALSLATPIIPLTSTLPVSGSGVSGVGAAVPGVVETPSANFDKSDQVLFKAQDEFLRRLKEKSAKGSKPPALKVSAVVGMTMALPPKPTKSPPPSFPPTPASVKRTQSPLPSTDQGLKERHATDVDLRLGNVDLKKLSKDIDAIMKKDVKKESEETLLKKDYQPATESPSESKSDDKQIQDVDMRRDKAKQEPREGGGETKKKRPSIVRPPPSMASRPPSATTANNEDPPESRRRQSTSSSASNDDKRKFEGESWGGQSSRSGSQTRGEGRGETHSSRGDGHSARDGRGEKESSRGDSQSSRGESRDAPSEKESVWRRLSAETFSQRDSESGKPIAKEDVRRYSEMCDNYYRTYYEEQYGAKGKRHESGSGGARGGSSGHSGSGSRGLEDSHRHDEQQHHHQHHEHHHGGGGGDHHHGERYSGDDGDDRRIREYSKRNSSAICAVSREERRIGRFP